ncbi:MAG: RING finger domain-containing protein [Promethearchaeota archaeon]
MQSRIFGYRSRIYLYLLLKYLQANRSVITVNKEKLAVYLHDSGEKIVFDSNLINELSAIAENNAAIDSLNFLGRIIPDLDSLDIYQHFVRISDDGNLILNNLHQVSILNRLGILEIRDRDSARGSTWIDKNVINRELEILENETFKGFEDFVQYSHKYFMNAKINRYKTLIDGIQGYISSLLSDLSVEKASIQHGVKFTVILPVQRKINGIFSLINAFKERIDEIKDYLDKTDDSNVFVTRDCAFAVFNLINPLFSFKDADFQFKWVINKQCPFFQEILNKGNSALDFKSINVLFNGKTSIQKDFCFDLLLYLHEIGVLKIDTKKYSKSEKKEISHELKILIKKQLLEFLKKIWAPEQDEIFQELIDEAKLSSLLPKLLKSSLEYEEKGLIQKTIQNGLDSTQKEVKVISDRYFERLEKIRAWCDEIKGFLPASHANILKPLISSISYQFNEVSRFITKMDFFFKENKLQEEKIEIRKEIDNLMSRIDQCINVFENGIGKFLSGNFLDLERLHDYILDFKGKYKDLVGQLNSVVKKYDAFKLISIIDDLRKFLESRDNKIHFITNMILVELKENAKKILRGLDELSKVIKESRLVTDEAGDLSGMESDILIINDIEKKESELEDRVDVQLLKKQLSIIKAKLEQIDCIKSRLEDKRDKLLYQLLEDEEKEAFLKEKKIGECIICYEPITTLDEDEIIVCPHCGRIAHYLCLAWWLERHAICPVCHEQLLTPSTSKYYNE